MKKLFASLALIASMVLAPLSPTVGAAVAGTFSVSITTPNVSATNITFPALSGGVNAGSSVAATSTLEVTGASGTTTSITVGSTELLAASSSIAFNTNGTTTASDIASAINANTSASGFAAVSSGTMITLTAPAGTSFNGQTAVVTSDYLSTNGAFAGGTSASAGADATATSGHLAAVASGTSSDLTLNIGSTTITLTAGMTAAQAASTTAAQINANASAPYTASVTNSDEVMLTAKATGSAGNGVLIAADLSYNGTAEVATFTPSDVTAGETFRATVNGTNYDVTANASSTVASVTTALVPMINTNAAVSCMSDSTKVTCTASTAGTPFTASATVFAGATPTVGPIVIVSDNANTACAKVGDNVTLTFTTSGPLATSSSSVLIGGSTTTIVSLGGNVYSASRVFDASTTSGVLTFRLDAEDQSGSSTVATTTTDSSFVTFLNSAPTITLNGDANMNLGFSAPFVDPGASASDALHASITPTVSGSVNISNPGTYTLLYTATDCAGNVATTTRAVTVGQASIPGGNSGGGSSVPPSSSNGLGFIASAIAQLLAPITTGPAVPQVIREVLGATTVRFTFNLKRGMSGEAIALLQQKLAALGFYTGSQTGFFGPVTENAVIRFQKARNISGTGLVGPQTRAELNAE